MPEFFPNRLFFRPRPTVNRFGEPVPPRPCVDSAVVRRSASGEHLEVRMTGCGLLGTANGPHVSVDGSASSCVCFDEDTLVAVVPPDAGRRVRVVVTYGSLVCGDFIIKTTPGARTRRWSIRIDDRIREASSQ